MKILVLGSNGMAGHVIVRYLKQQGFDVATAARSNADYYLDIEHSPDFEIMLEFDYVINCIGLLVKDSIDRPDRAIIINSWFPKALENALKNTTTKIIHLSTDCVFDGNSGSYVETDKPTETNFYGKSKAHGEINNNKDITFRMSIIGPELKNNGTGLFNWIYNTKDQILPGWENAWWNGVTTLQLAKCIEKYLNNPAITGLYHLVNNDVVINKYMLLSIINEIFDLKKTILKTQGSKSINKILLDTRKLIDFEIPNYNIQLQELKEFYFLKNL